MPLECMTEDQCSFGALATRPFPESPGDYHSQVYGRAPAKVCPGCMEYLKNPIRWTLKKKRDVNGHPCHGGACGQSRDAELELREMHLVFGLGSATLTGTVVDFQVAERRSRLQAVGKMRGHYIRWLSLKVGIRSEPSPTGRMDQLAGIAVHLETWGTCLGKGQVATACRSQTATPESLGDLIYQHRQDPRFLVLMDGANRGLGYTEADTWKERREEMRWP